MMTKLTCSALNFHCTGWQLFLNAIGTVVTVVLWNVKNLHLRKLVMQGYKLVVIAIVVNSNNNWCTGYYIAFNRKTAVQF